MHLRVREFVCVWGSNDSLRGGAVRVGTDAVRERKVFDGKTHVLTGTSHGALASELDRDWASIELTFRNETRHERLSHCSSPQWPGTISLMEHELVFFLPVASLCLVQKGHTAL